MKISHKLGVKDLMMRIVTADEKEETSLGDSHAIKEEAIQDVVNSTRPETTLKTEKRRRKKEMLRDLLNWDC